MLFVYTPNEQTDENRQTIQKAIKSYDGPNIHFKYKDGISTLSFVTSWCRELTTSAFNEWGQYLPPGKLNIYGIRKHGDAWGSQPSGAIGKIDKRDRVINMIFYNLFQFMTEMISHIFDTHTTDLHSTKFWLSVLACSVPGNMVSKHSIECLLNCDPNRFPDTPLWTTDEMYGTMYNVPSQWMCSPAVMSYLLYLPRVWGAFYSEPQVLKHLIKAGRLRHNTDQLAKLFKIQAKDSLHPLGADVSLWKYVASKLMLPLWLTNFGKKEFWGFTYLLIREGIAVSEGLERVPGLLEVLKYNRCSGFMSWIRSYRGRAEMNAPVWVSALDAFLKEYGPNSLLLFRPLVKHV